MSKGLKVRPLKCTDQEDTLDKASNWVCLLVGHHTLPPLHQPSCLLLINTPSPPVGGLKGALPIGGCTLEVGLRW